MDSETIITVIDESCSGLFVTLGRATVCKPYAVYSYGQNNKSSSSYGTSSASSGSSSSSGV